MLTVFYQDFKDRLVFWWLFPVIGTVYGVLHINEVGTDQFLIHIGLSCSMVIVLLTTLVFYSKLRFKTFNLTESFGLGDILLLFGLSLSYSPLYFIILLVFGLLFSLILHQFINTIMHNNDTTPNTDIYVSYNQTVSVPLAGYLGLYFVAVILFDWFGTHLNLYQI